MDKSTICTIPIVLVLATGIPTALAVHTPAYLYGFGLGNNAGLRGYYDVMNDCSNRPYLSTNITGAIKHFTLQQVNDCGKIDINAVPAFHRSINLSSYFNFFL